MKIPYYLKPVIFLFLSLFFQNISTRARYADIGFGKSKLLALCIFLLLAGQTVFAQAPSISSFSPASGAVGTAVAITGTSFNSTAANNIVFFGAARATVTAASATSLTVTVPTGATYAAITVLNTATSLAAYSSKFFLPTFTPNKGSVTSTDIAPGVDFATGSSPQSVAIGDIDGDGKPDLVVANLNSATISVLLNTSTAGNFSFASKVDFNTQQSPYSVAIGDLDGDGKPDIVVSNGSETSIAVFRNTSSPGSISFATAMGFKTGSFPWSVAIGDLDGDGRADIVVGNYGDNTVSVLHNLGNPGNISFDAKMDIAVGSTPWSVAIGDIDGDNKPEIVVANTGSATVSVLLNTSSPGIVNFAPKADFTTGTGSKSVAIGDIDGDGKPDIAVAISGSVSVLQNTGSSGHVNFAAPASFAAGPNLWPITIGDIDGDGKPDIVTANVTTGSSVVSVLANTSSTGSISFAAQTAFVAEAGPYFVAVGDIDGDGKPDIVVTNGNGVSLLRNTPVFTPSITSFTPASGPVGTLVTISGANLGNPNLFTIGGATAIVVSNTGTQLVGMVMPGVTTGAITLNTNSGSATGPGNFTVLATPFPTTQQGNKLAGTGATGTSFQGNSVAISADGNTAAVGGYGDNSNLGAVWIFTRTGGMWTQQGSKLVGTGNTGLYPPANGGIAVAISADGNTLLVGKHEDGSGAGAAWVFTRTAGVWAQQGNKLVGTGYVGTGNGAAQGFSVALSGDGNTAVLGGISDNSGQGAAWVFTRSGGVWAQQGNKLAASDNTINSEQGNAVAISADGKTIMVGGPADNSQQGAAWIYTLSGGIWTQQGSKLVGTGNVGAARQGTSVALSADGNTAIEGGWYDSSQVGAMWVFTRSGSTWTQQGSKLVGTGYTGVPQQGLSLSISADGNTIVEGGQGDNNQQGAAWVFTRNAGVWAQRGNKLVGNGVTNAAIQGISIGLSADGTTMIEGGDTDNNAEGAAWIFFASPPDATLSNLTLSSGTFSPAFAPATNNYNVSVTNTTSSATVTPTANVAGATVKVNGTAVPSGSASGAINLKAGANNISVVVTAQDGITTGTYTLTVVRASIAAPNISYAGPQTYTTAVKIASLSPTNSGGGVPAIGFSQTSTFQKGSLSPIGVVSDASGNVFTTSGRYIWKIAPGGTPAVFAGSGADGHANGQGPAASFGNPTGLAIDAHGNLYTADAENNMIRKITPQGLVSTLAGNGDAKLVDGVDTVASFSTPTGVAVGADGNVYVGDSGNKAIRKITPAGLVSTIAISSNTDANYMFSTGLGITVDGANNIYIVDPAYFVIRKFTQTGAMNIAAGIAGKQGYVDGPATSAQFDEPLGLTIDGQNDLYVSDLYGMREITYDGMVSTIAGYGASGGPGTSVDGIGHAAIFQGGSRQITADGKGKLYLAEINNSAIRTISYVGYAINNTLPAGLTFNYLTGGITGTPTSFSPAANYAISAYNLGGKSAANLSIAVAANANLSALKLSKGTLSPAFAAGTTVYSVTETNAISSITVTPTAIVATSTTTVNGTTVASGSASGNIALNVGSNVITTVVTAQDGVTKMTYTITVTRAASTDATLSHLAISPGTIKPAFTSTNTAYTVAVGNGITSVTVTPTTNEPNATIKIGGKAVVSGTASAPIALAVGANTIATVITAQNGVTTKNYKITVTRAPSNNAKLAGLTTSSGALSPAFSNTVTSYTRAVSNATTAITFKPVAVDKNATITVNGAVTASGTSSAAQPLAVGSNTETIKVTAQDGVTSITYTVTVNRATGPLTLNTVYEPVSVTSPEEKPNLDDDIILVHQGLSPNGDGINDFLQIDGIQAHPDNKLTIMNHSGQLVFESKGYDNSTKVFDGHSNKTGVMQLPGTYFYSLDYTVKGEIKHKTGFIVLKY